MRVVDRRLQTEAPIPDTVLAYLGKIDRQADRPPYKQVADLLRVQVDNGRYSPGDRLPSEAELSAHFGVARMTVRSAIQELRLAGLVSPEHGRGVFVRTKSQDAQPTTLDSATSETGSAIRHHLQQARSAAMAVSANAIVGSPEALLAASVARLVVAVELLTARGATSEATSVPCLTPGVLPDGQPPTHQKSVASAEDIAGASS